MQNVEYVMNELPSLIGLNAFVQVVESGGFAKAAVVLGLSTSATSKAVARLEDELGVKLLHRTTRSLSLTPEGERIREGGRTVLAELKALTTDVSDSLAAPTGRLTVSVPVAFGRMWLIKRLAGFIHRYPGIALDLSLNDREIDLAADGIDVAIRAGALPDNVNLIAATIMIDQLRVCASPAYLDRFGEPEGLADLTRHRCLNFRNSRSGRIFPWIFSDGRALRRLDPEGSFTCDDGASVGAAAEAGMGLSQMPSFMAEAALDDGRLREVLAPYRPPPTPFTALYLDRRLVSSRIRAFIDYLTSN